MRLVSPSIAALGITRVASVTGLDYIRIPVVMVVRPASRNLSVMQGKGLNDQAAIASGLMEALESFCSERIRGLSRLESTEAAGCDLSCLVPEFMVRRKPAPDTAIPWTKCTDMFGGPARYFPSELIFADFTWPPPAGQGYFVTTTNGLAAGNSCEEALLHALCEVIERDAVALWMAAHRACRTDPPLDPQSLTGGECCRLIPLLDAAGIQFDIWDITSDIGIPSFLCAIGDAHDGSEFTPGRIVGAGCHPSADIALCRAITEAAQARLTIIVGARDDVDLDIYRLMPVNSLFARAFPNPPSKQTAKFEDRSVSTDDIAEDLEIVLARLDVCGVGTVVFSELPCPLKQVKCVRVLAPQLESVFEKSWYRPGERARALLATL